MTPDMNAMGTQENVPPSSIGGFGVALVIITAIIGWAAIGGHFLSEASLFAGFMILWYWAKVERLAMRRLPASIIGALAGIGIAWTMFYGASRYGGAGLAAGLLMLAIAIYMDVIQKIPIFINAATMLFSIVVAAPLVQLKVNWIELCFATAGGGMYFGGYVAVAAWLASKLPLPATKPTD
ncbi:hypothetical protein [Novosphingobium sp. MMS21-SN21R]|uniref:hypothetical protein n=1 Tax=Novosphingobium sp. MMS21-SN21R TaxID=2969298 RepID=UPI002887024E|nr:hypothetical protein [Novosphingobium sp. MMS21-SN21R]MDT0507029.1 hypothetical protein [Novosphingobium sp. MMS21-SN21R]